MVKNLPETWVLTLVGKIPWRRKWQPSPVFLPRKSHGQRSLAAYGLWGHKRVGHDLVSKQQLKESSIQQPLNTYTLRRKGKQHKEKSTNDLSKSFIEVEVQILNECMNSPIYS